MKHNGRETFPPTDERETDGVPEYYVAERFYPTERYEKFSSIKGRKEIVTYDCCLCPKVSPQSRKKPLRKDEQIIAAFKNTPKTAHTPGKDFEFCGYDLSETTTMISAVTNCGGFDGVINPADLNEYGIFSSREKAVEIQKILHGKFPYDDHADCEIYELWRKV
ncbi:MAG: hypothetical protein LBP62_01845 [Clostridiales bacterium]|jgi:hypothetical protein|nr:hypothetical protein [Clostridiales bacterium]